MRNWEVSSLKRKKMDDRYRKLITHWNPFSPIVEGYRTLRINIQFASSTQVTRTLLVTSTGPSEGKTITSANLAIMMAKDQKNTVYVDTDLRKPRAHFTFDLPNIRGVSTYLKGESSLKEIVQDSGVPNLSVITCGPIPPNPTELLGLNRIDLLIEELLQRFDFVIFDSPPMMIADAVVLATKVDGCIVVIDSQKTKRESAGKAIEQLKNVNGNILGVVLNNKKIRNKEEYYSYT